MLLTVDIGNTNVVMGLMPERGQLASNLRFPTDKRRTVQEFMEGFEALVAMHGFDFSNVDGAIVSSVVPELTDSVVASVRAKTGEDPLVVNHRMDLGLTIDMDTPEKLGVDMIADAAGAVNDYEGNLAIFDMGTATTCSVVNAERVYVGSIIMPGVVISQDALTAKASALPFIKFEQPKRLIGRDTVDCMRSGVIYANAAMMDGLVDRISDELNGPVLAIATGGISRLIVPACRRYVVHDPNLLLKGLWDLYHRNHR
ncbi:MAG: type III pantothenate kinase [Slackia sp.]|nr:type III pantothenate kinase [Slackia sp.]